MRTYNKLTSLLAILVAILCTTSIGSSEAFAWAGWQQKEQTSSSSLITSNSKESNHTDTEKSSEWGTWEYLYGEEKTDTEKEEDIKNDINAYIIESYKAQGSKIIKDLSVKFIKSIPEKKDRQEAYRKIRESFKLRLEKTEKLRMTEIRKLILREYLTHMIDLLDKKIEELN